MSNPFTTLEAYLTNIQDLLIDIKHETIPQNSNAEKLWSKQEACDGLGVTMNTLSKYIKNGTIPAYGIGSRVVLKRSEVLSSLVRINK